MKQRYTYFILLFFIVAGILTDCNSMRRSTKRNSIQNTGVENFDEFYDRFHADSVFQMSRIKSPLDGMSVDGFGKQKWNRDNWFMMKVRIYDIDTSQYRISYNKTEKDFVQKIWIEDSGFSSEYRFELIDDQWFLVYVLDQNL